MESAKRNYWRIAILEVLVFGLLIAIYAIEKALGMGEIAQIVVQEVILFALFFGLNYFWIKQPVKLGTTVSFGKLVLIAVPFIIISLYMLLIFLAPHSRHTVTLAIVSGLGAGIFEEYLFRGIILGMLLKAFPKSSKTRTIWYSVVISSFLFGVTHASNFFAQSISTTLMQMISAWSIGFLLAALYLRSGSIILPMLFHSAWDCTSFLLSGSTFVTSTVTTAAPVQAIGGLVLFLLIAAFYFRRSKISQIDLKHFA